MRGWVVVLWLGSWACKGGQEATDGGPTGSSTSTATCTTLADRRCVEETFHDPTVLQPDADGVLHLTLAASEVTLDGQRHCARLYNGVYPGPTMREPC
ncbi:MAG: hypothetical protein H6735_23795 [Alphaproteobacteria bacterium]|nr:hypothetical protein [Alphaproteobacteria bacterium]